jgi:DNA-directed RNA polymerase beta' subunit
MQDNIHSMREWYQISEIEFGFIFPDELRRLSVCEIEKSQVYDTDKKPLKGGLYDPLLGVSPNERDAVCSTCGHKGLECSGHPGHIELVVPAYNPLVVDVLLKLLRMNCFYCHRFRIREKIKEDYVVMLELLRNDRIKETYEYYDINV